MIMSWNNMKISKVVVALFCVCSLRILTGTCQRTKDINTYKKVSCDFEDDLCSWEVINSSDVTLSWLREDNYANDVLELDMENKLPGDKGRVVSPWLTPLAPGRRCQLQFAYYIGANDNCRLSLLQETLQTTLLLWNSSKETPNSWYMSDPVTVHVACDQRRFRLLFEGEKLTPDACGRYWFTTSYDKLKLDDIDLDWAPAVTYHEPVTLPDGFLVNPPDSLPHSPPADVPLLADVYTPVTEDYDKRIKASLMTKKARPSDWLHVSTSATEKDVEDSGASTMVLVGIAIPVVIGIVIILVIVVVVVVVCKRKKRQRSKVETGSVDFHGDDIARISVGKTDNSTEGEKKGESSSSQS